MPAPKPTDTANDAEPPHPNETRPPCGPWRPGRPGDPAGAAVDRVIDAGILVGLAVLILVGFATSYRTLRDLAATDGGYPSWLAPAVPLSFDLGIVVLSLKVARAAREGRTAPVMRALVMLLSAATVAANASAAATATARLLHVVPPAMFVVCFESVVITARRHALARRGLLPQPLPRVRAARWIFAFPSTWALWRRMVLDDTRWTATPTGTGPAAEQGTPPRADRHPAATSDPGREGADDGATPALPVKASRATTRHRGPDDAARPSGARTRRARTARTATRDGEATRLLAAHPDIAAPELARRLATAGWPVSTRTAQRLRGRLVPEAAPVASRPLTAVE